MSDPELSLLVVNYNTWRLCVDAVRTFAEHAPTRPDGTPMRWEAIVVDNASPQRDAAAEAELRELCESTGGALVMHGENGGYSAGMNLAFARSRGQWILVSNPDIRYLPNTIDPLLRAMERDPSIGAAAPRGYWDVEKEGRLPPNILPTIGDLLALTLATLFRSWVRRYARRRTRDAMPVWISDGDVDLRMLSGCCFLMRRELVDSIGFFDERFPLYYEDTDLSVRIARAGRRIVQVGGAEVVHLFDRSGQTDPTMKMERYWQSRRAYYRKWYGPLGGALYDLTRSIQNTKWGRKRVTRVPYPRVHDLGSGHGKPVIELPRAYDRLLVEFALDPKFFLAGGILTSGSRWLPNDEMFKAFGPTTYWFRVVDAGDPRLPVIGIYRYQQLHPAVALPHSPEADERGRAQLRRFQETGQWA